MRNIIFFLILTTVCGNAYASVEKETEKCIKKYYDVCGYTPKKPLKKTVNGCLVNKITYCYCEKQKICVN